ncbi:MAG TPA: trypsin-like peptidase domain-containing protein [Candidatus Dormibacteraeota bacterium]
MKRLRGAVLAAALVVGVAAPALYLWRDDASERTALQAEQRTIAQLSSHVSALEARPQAPADWAVVAARVERSVVTVETSTGLGSGWVARSEASGSDLVTNFHVVAEAWNAGVTTVDVKQGDRTFAGTIARVDRQDDLALVHVNERLPALATQQIRPPLGSTVMAVGSPLGLGGTVTVGVVSGFRSLEGSDYLQFSAPISPGNSGGPVVDAHGRVIAVASAKLVGDGVEALSLGIPVQVACAGVVACAVGQG